MMVPSFSIGRSPRRASGAATPPGLARRTTVAAHQANGVTRFGGCMAATARLAFSCSRLPSRAFTPSRGGRRAQESAYPPAGSSATAHRLTVRAIPSRQPPGRRSDVLTKDQPDDTGTDGRPADLRGRHIDTLEGRYGTRFLLEPAPDEKLPKSGMPALDAMRLVGEEVLLDGLPMRNLATFVTTWMEPEAVRLIKEALHTNFIDHAEYPQTAEIEQRCIRMLADLFHAPGETTGARTQGSSEAIMLGALSLKWKWRHRMTDENKGVDRPNLVFGGDVHVVWEKFCRYFDVEPRIVPLRPDKYTIGPGDVEPHVDANTIGVAVVLGTTFTGHADDIRGINDHLVAIKHERGLDVPLHVDAASGGFVWPFLYPDSEWDFRLEQVRSINASGHKFGLVYPGIGWLAFREREHLPEGLVFSANYLGRPEAHIQL